MALLLILYLFQILIFFHHRFFCIIIDFLKYCIKYYFSRLLRFERPLKFYIQAPRPSLFAMLIILIQKAGYRPLDEGVSGFTSRVAALPTEGSREESSEF